MEKENRKRYVSYAQYGTAVYGPPHSTITTKPYEEQFYADIVGAFNKTMPSSEPILLVRTAFLEDSELCREEMIEDLRTTLERGIEVERARVVKINRPKNEVTFSIQKSWKEDGDGVWVNTIQCSSTQEVTFELRRVRAGHILSQLLLKDLVERYDVLREQAFIRYVEQRRTLFNGKQRKIPYCQAGLQPTHCALSLLLHEKWEVIDYWYTEDKDAQHRATYRLIHIIEEVERIGLAGPYNRSSWENFMFSYFIQAKPGQVRLSASDTGEIQIAVEDFMKWVETAYRCFVNAISTKE